MRSDQTRNTFFTCFTTGIIFPFLCEGEVLCISDMPSLFHPNNSTADVQMDDSTIKVHPIKGYQCENCKTEDKVVCQVIVNGTTVFEVVGDGMKRAMNLIHNGNMLCGSHEKGFTVHRLSGLPLVTVARAFGGGDIVTRVMIALVGSLTAALVICVTSIAYSVSRKCFDCVHCTITIMCPKLGYGAQGNTPGHRCIYASDHKGPV